MATKPHIHLVRGPIVPGPHLYTVHCDAGALATFLGIIRPDKVEGKVVSQIEYSAYDVMAENIFEEIEREVAGKYNIISIQIFHSVGLVKAGEISMWIGVYSLHRDAAFGALREAVETVKKKAPVWKKEIFADQSYRWVDGNE